MLDGLQGVGSLQWWVSSPWTPPGGLFSDEHAANGGAAAAKAIGDALLGPAVPTPATSAIGAALAQPGQKQDGQQQQRKRPCRKAGDGHCYQMLWVVGRASQGSPADLHIIASGSRVAPAQGCGVPPLALRLRVVRGGRGLSGPHSPRHWPHHQHLDGGMQVPIKPAG